MENPKTNVVVDGRNVQVVEALFLMRDHLLDLSDALQNLLFELDLQGRNEVEMSTNKLLQRLKQQK
ncbi:hypothetical protein [Solimicrobium silvestre]|uniref:Uncharacterized protein n=1 Tax=Solimicrobium silvestre TaxID=2099400 RepID=A0A2S9GZ63_9BURK|nr:hypothetical protein [Solimicrobium silvestre]PRC92988.1 hypothetical protein S2091_2405 [Solimicrobium silvestre]